MSIDTHADDVTGGETAEDGRSAEGNKAHDQEHHHGGGEGHGGGDDGGGHHESPEVVDGRQRMAVWLFIGGDMVILAGLLFTYLYLRGTNTDGHWMNMVGYTGHPWSYYNNILFVKGGSLPNPTTVSVNPISAGFYWVVTLVTVVSAGVIWLGEKRLRVSRDVKAFVPIASLATVVALIALVLTIVQLRQIPEIFVTQNDSAYMAYTSYSSAILVLEGSALLHMFVLAFLGLGLTVRASKGVISGDKWYQVRLVRLFWVWVAVSSVIVAAVVTTVNTIH
jgi:heme/copper-type cytochrome/quinol oxidase subunit 3